MSPMRVLLVVHRYPPHARGGVETWAATLAEGLRDAGEKPAVCTLEDPAHLDPLLPTASAVRDDTAGFPVWRVPFRLDMARGFRETYRHPELERTLLAVLREARPDIVHLGHPDGWGDVPLRLARRRATPTLVTLHDWKWLCARGQMLRPDGVRCDRAELATCARCVDDELRAGPFAALGRSLVPAFLRSRRAARAVDTRPEPSVPARRRLALRHRAFCSALQGADLLIAPSRFARHRYEAAGITAPIRHIPNALPAIAAKPLPDGPLRLGYCSSLDRSKGLETLVAAVASLPGVELHVWGAIALPAPARVHPPFPPGAAAAAMATVHAVCLPSMWDENDPFVAVEARAAGRALLVSDRGGLPEHVRHGVDGLVLPAGDVGAWRAAIAALDVATIARFAAAGTPRPPFIEAHRAAYRELLTSRGDGPLAVHPPISAEVARGQAPPGED